MASDRRETPRGTARAQERVDRIRSFREELEQLESGAVLVLSEEQRARLLAHHEEVLAELRGQFDVDTSTAQKQLSWGMRITSFLGALALCAAVYFFFNRIWGLISTPVQVVVVIAGPILGVLLTSYAARREKTLYFASLLALIALSCFILDLNVLGLVFNIRPTQNALLAWACFALILAYTHGLRVLLVAGIVILTSYLSATFGTWGGMYWLDFFERPENFILSGIIIFAVPFVMHHRVFDDFPPLYRLFGALAILGPVLVLANWGDGSYLFLPSETIEILYQILGFVLSSAAIALGIRRGWRGVTNLGSVFFVVLLFIKFFDWWWDWMPKYLFFLILGLVAIGILVSLKRLRAFAVRRTS